jgi:hypothetical protein
MIDIILFLVLGVLVIPLVLLSFSSNLYLLKYYPILLILVASYLNKLKLKYNETELFTELYLTKPSTNLGYFSTCFINIFVLLLVILLAIRVNINVSFGEKFVLGFIYFAILYLLSNHGMDKLYEVTENNHVYGAGYSFVVFISLSLVLMFVNLGNISKLDLSLNNNNFLRANNNGRPNNTNNGRPNNTNNGRPNNTNNGRPNNTNNGRPNNTNNGRPNNTNNGRPNNTNNGRPNNSRKNKKLMNNISVSRVNNLNTSA